MSGCVASSSLPPAPPPPQLILCWHRLDALSNYLTRNLHVHFPLGPKKGSEELSLTTCAMFIRHVLLDMFIIRHVYCPEA